MYSKCNQLTRQFVKSFASSQSVLFQMLNNEKHIQKRWAGHAKWQNIKHTKETNDQARSATFQKITRMIPLAVKNGGPNMNINVQLRRLFEESKKMNMPKATFERAVQNSLTHSLQKPYWIVCTGSRGIIVGIEVNFAKNNISYIKSILGSVTKKHGLKIETHHGDLCTERGVIIAEPPANTESPYDKAIEDAIETGVDEVFENDDKTLLFECHPNGVDSVSKKLSDMGYCILSATVELDFQNLIKFSDDEIKNLEAMISKIQVQYEEVLRMTYNAAT